MRKNNGIYIYFDVYECTLMKLKERKTVVENYSLVTDYEDAVGHIANFLNSHMWFSAIAQEELPDLLVLAWHYAHKEYGCPLKPSEYETFMEALRVDVYKMLLKRINGFVGVKEWYGSRIKH